jgi:hypothetical protein
MENSDSDDDSEERELDRALVRTFPFLLSFALDTVRV